MGIVNNSGLTQNFFTSDDASGNAGTIRILAPRHCRKQRVNLQPGRLNELFRQAPLRAARAFPTGRRHNELLRPRSTMRRHCVYRHLRQRRRSTNFFNRSSAGNAVINNCDTARARSNLRQFHCRTTRFITVSRGLYSVSFLTTRLRAMPPSAAPAQLLTSSGTSTAGNATIQQVTPGFLLLRGYFQRGHSHRLSWGLIDFVSASST